MIAGLVILVLALLVAWYLKHRQSQTKDLGHLNGKTLLAFIILLIR